MIPNTLPDSGTRSEFDTGAVRDGETGKGRFDLLPPNVFKLAYSPRGAELAENIMNGDATEAYCNAVINLYTQPI